jgi:hypothetical protein
VNQLFHLENITVASKATINAIIEKLNVEKKLDFRKMADTYCNIYTFDFVFLPRFTFQDYDGPIKLLLCSKKEMKYP